MCLLLLVLIYNNDDVEISASVSQPPPVQPLSITVVFQSGGHQGACVVPQKIGEKIRK